MNDHNENFIAEFGLPQWLTITVAPVSSKAKPFWRKVVYTATRVAIKTGSALIASVPVVRVAAPVLLASAAVLVGAWQVSTRKRPNRDGPLLISGVDSDGDSGAVVDDFGVVGGSVDGWGAATDTSIKPYMAFSGMVARVVKVRMGVPKDTPANRIVAWELCGKELAARNVRKCDTAKFQSLSHRLVFIPSKWDVFIDEAMKSDEVLNRLAPQAGRRGFWSWFLRYKEARRVGSAAGRDQ